MRLACQARSFGDGIYADEQAFLEVLGEIGEIGFEGMEANWKNMERYFRTPDVFADELTAADVALLGAHYGGTLWDPSQRETLLDDCEDIARFVMAVGGEYVVCSCPGPKDDVTRDDALVRMAECLDELGGICATHGIRIAYHNHFWESEGQGLVRLADSTDVANVAFAYDTGNDIQGGGDPAATLRALGDRVKVVHLKDHSESDRAALGEGVLDLDAVKGVLEEGGFRHWVVLEEETKPADARTHVEACMGLMRQFVA